MHVATTVDGLDVITLNKAYHSSLMLQQFGAFRQEGLFCDFNIVVDGHKFPVHQIVICANSMYFRAMLTHSTIEKEKREVELKGLDKESVATCIAFMYGEQVCTCESKCALLLRAADMLQIDELLKTLIFYLCGKLTVENLNEIHKLATTHFLRPLQYNCLEFAALNFESLSKSDEFKCLDAEFCAVLFRNRVNALPCTKLKALINWASVDPQCRAKAFSSILQSMDLLQVNMPYLRYLLENEPLIRDAEPNYRRVSSTIFDRAGVLAYSYPKNDGVNGLIVYLGQLNKMHIIGCDNWEFDAINIPTPVGPCFSLAALCDYIYVFTHRSVFQINIDTGTDVPAVREGKNSRYDHGPRPVVVVDHCHIYVVEGGKCSDESCIEEYNQFTDTWIYLTRGKGFVHHASVLFDNKIFCIGGVIADTMISSVLAYHLIENTWLEYPSLPNPRMSSAAAAFDKSIYIIGGRESLDGALATNLVLDTKTKVWSSIAPMFNTREGCSAFNVMDDIYICGGCDASKGNQIECYDPSENEWLEVLMPYSDFKILCAAAIALPITIS